VHSCDPPSLPSLADSYVVGARVQCQPRRSIKFVAAESLENAAPDEKELYTADGIGKGEGLRLEKDSYVGTGCLIVFVEHGSSSSAPGKIEDSVASDARGSGAAAEADT